MVQKAKKPDKLVAGVLALLTAFSPVASVVPVYASSTEDGYGNSITMDPDSIQIEDTGDDGIVLDNSSQDSDGITVMDGDDSNDASGSGDIVIDDGDSDGSGDIVIDDPEQGDGIVIENPDDSDDGISLGEPDDGIVISDEIDDGITIDESGNIFIDPWSEIDDMADDEYFSEHPEEFELYDRLCALNADIRSIHGFVTFTPADSDDLTDQRIVRVIRSEDTNEYTAVATDGNGKEVYRELLDDAMGLPWYQFIKAGTEYLVEITADDGYFLYDCSVSDSSGNSTVTELYSDESTYQCRIVLLSDVNIVANFSDVNSDSDTEQSVSVDQNENSINLADAGSNLIEQTAGDTVVLGESELETLESEESESETVMLETEANQLGYEEVLVAGEMADDVEIPNSVEPDSNSAYEDYIISNLDLSVVEHNKLELVNALTLVDTTYDDSMIDKYDLGYICDYNPGALITGNYDIQNVYDVGDDTYYVSFVDTQHFNVNSRVFECGVARNNNNAEVFHDCIYDNATGIVYIPKEHFDGEDGVRVQMCQALDCKMDYKETAFCVRLNDDVFMSSFDMFRDYTSIFIDPELDPVYLDVFINGRLADPNECSYDASTGELVIYHPGSLISFLDIKDTRNFGTRILNTLFPVSVVQAAISDSKQKAMQSAGKIEVSGTVKNGEVYDGNADLFYWGAPQGGIDTAKLQKLLKKHGFGNCSIVGGVGFVNPASYNPTGDLTNINELNPTFMDFVVDVSSMSLKKSPYSFSNIDGGKNNVALVLGCNEYSSYNGTNLQLGEAKFEDFGDKTRAARGAKIKVKVANHWTEGDKKYVTFGIVTSKITSQLGSGLIKFEYGEEKEEGPKYIRLRKTVSEKYKESWKTLSDNNNYQLGGCIFGIYTNEKSAENAPVLKNTTKDSASILDSVGENNLWKRVTTDEDGYTKFLKVTDKDDKLLYDKLYVVELKAPYGFRICFADAKHYVTEIDLRSMFPDAARSASRAASLSLEDNSVGAVMDDEVIVDSITEVDEDISSDVLPMASGTLMRAAAASSSDSDKVGYILLGDSRFYGYVYCGHDKVSGGSNNGNGNVGSQCSVKMKDDPNTFVVAEVGGGLSYAKGTGVKDINNIKKQYPAIKKWVLLATLGVNDITPSNTSKVANDYANFYKGLKGEFDKIIVTSVLPTESGCSIANSTVSDFNTKLKSAVAGLDVPKIQYLNLKSDFEALHPKYASDHLHFDTETYKKTYRMMRDKLSKLNLATSDSTGDSSGDDKVDKTIAVDGNKATIGYGDAPLRDPYDMSVFKTETLNPDVECLEDLKIPEEMNGAEYKLQFYNYYPELGDTLEEQKKNAVDFINGKYKGADGKLEDPNTYKAGDVLFRTTTCKVTCIHSDNTKHEVTLNGSFNLNEPKSIVRSNWEYYYDNIFEDASGATSTERTAMIPLGIVTLTETKAPGDYEIPDNHTDVGIVVPYFSKQLDRMNANVYWCHDDPYIKMTNTKHAIHPYGKDDYTHSSKAVYGFEEGSSYVNLGLLKIDKETGKPGRPVNDVLSLKGIKFSVYHADDCPCGDTVKNPLDHDAEIETGEKFEKLELVTDDDGCADTVGLNIKDGKDKGVLTKGHKYYLKESESNDVYLLNEQKYLFTVPESVPDEWKHADGSPALVFPDKDGSGKDDSDKDGSVIGWGDVLHAKDLLDNKNKDKQQKVLWIENTSPKIGVGVSKFDLMRDSSELGPNGKANHGNATLEGHTYVVLNGTKSEVRLNDKKMSDGKGTKIKSIWEHGDHLKNPYAPTYKELYHYAEESDFQVDPDGNGYICAVLKTDKDGNAETAPDLLPMGVYYVIEVDTKVTDEGYHDYLVNTLDVGHVGEYEPGPEETDEDGKKKDTDKYVLKRDGKEVTAGEMSPDGEVFQAEFTELLKEELYPGEDKSLADKKQPADMPPRGGVEFQKYDLYADSPYVSGDSDLSGFEFTIINVSEDVVKNKDEVEVPSWKYHGYTGKDQFMSLKYNQVRAIADTYAVQKVVTELVDDPDPIGAAFAKNGKVNMGRTGNQDLPFGDYLIIETGVPKNSGYKLNTRWIGYFEIREDGKMVQVQNVTGDDHNMDAHRYRGYNNMPMKFAKDGIACPNTPVSMGIAIEKLDYEMKKPIAQGVASLKGATYAVINASDNPIATKDGRIVPSIQSLSDYGNDAVSFKYLYDIYKNDTRYARDGGHVVTTLTTDKRGFASTARDALPSGTYYVIEVKASPGYWIDENFVGKVCVRDDNICMAMTDKNNPTANGSYFVNVNYVHGYDGENTADGGGYQATNQNAYVYEPVQRCDLWFRKIDENGKPKANIPFLISYVAVNNEGDDGTSGFETVLESHVIVSDSNGVVSTAGADAKVTEGSSTFTYPGRDFRDLTDGGKPLKITEQNVSSIF